ncbi:MULTISPECIES: type I glyceraldehyde-3-phosphate dehydrogenase [Bacillales]|uniref:Glyceraldehyde-3-phosphate dehydrogenase n=1 Tax=Lysinibacillus louembei TaxID=1470088 RepID=A0ABZ0RT39_9BACI|nr:MULTISPECIES: type I glyceraldehyde-3-phosphate dehydrogenase [Bacillales]MCT6925424.1 type I glyceraldehyde-3-phosphate dehydrogenase [Metasolibacillus sp.]MCT6941549.1 type I glyceraldehyde-3-phosphate dehydrogenase [Metasolibacillus sp.]WPK10249.1 type I glyceraldehyde-3-phosphate dehydrogenase [Lysinibacillus louembei]
MTVKLAINGFGRIGRKVFREAMNNSEVEVVAINDLTDAGQLAHLLKYDSVHGIYDADVQAGENSFTVNGKEIKVYAEKDPTQLPWGELGVDIVLECTGIFNNKEKLSYHLQAGAKKAILSAPAKGDVPTYVMGVNHEDYNPETDDVLSNASCTTNCLAPLAKVLDEKFGIERGLMTTIHSYTNDQRILDLPHADLRRARAGALSMIPTTTGAAVAVSKVLPQLKGKLDGFSMRVPTPNVSCVDLVATLKKDVTVEEVNAALKEAAEGDLKGILDYNELPLVSSDYNGNVSSSTIDGLSTMVLENKLVKVISWYDNESGYSARLLDLALYVASKGFNK